MTNAGTGTFYDALSPIRTAAGAFDTHLYVPAPEGWYIAVSDIKGSTAVVESGRHSDVNFAAAAMIAALSNLCGPIPYQFGGDGAVALVPPDFAAEARKALARTRTFAARDFKLDLRIGFVPVSALAERGAEVLVGRYEPSPGNAYAVFLGSGVEQLELAVKERGDRSLTEIAAVLDGEDDGAPPDLTGLSCRWTPLKAARGRMVSLVIRGGDHGELHASLRNLAGVPALNATSLEAMHAKWPPRGLVREAKAKRRGMPLSLTVLRVAVETLCVYLIMKFNLRIGRFDPHKYRRELAENSVDFARAGTVLSLTFDCPADRIAMVTSFLDRRAAGGDLQYGMHISDHAVMTCFVTSTVDNQHVHFIDGGDGGYTAAATQLKGKLRAAA